MAIPANPLPILPPELLKQHHCLEPTDTRFRAIARLRQSLWREQQGFPCGRHEDAAGRSRRLGSRLTAPVARTGANLIDPALVPWARRELAYREVGALIETERFWGNLLASQPLVFSLFGPMKQDLRLATLTFRELAPDLVGTVIRIALEHSPGRADLRFTGDHTAFDVVLRCLTPDGRSALLAIEVKYSEAPGGSIAPARPRYAELSRAAGIFRDPDSPALRSGALEQLWHEQLLLTAMVGHGLYDEVRLLVIAPALNPDCQTALRRYQEELISPEPAKVGFQAITLEAVVDALGKAGGDVIATRLADRYLDFDPVHAALATSFGTPNPN